MTRAARIVLLNGVGSAGKSSIARALQVIAGAPFLHVEMESFIKMLPDGFWGDPEGFALETIEASGRSAIVIKAGPVGVRLMLGMRRAIAALAAAGNELIVDDVLTDGAAADYGALLAGFTSTGSAWSRRSPCWRRASAPAATGDRAGTLAVPARPCRTALCPRGRHGERGGCRVRRADQTGVSTLKRRHPVANP